MNSKKWTISILSVTLIIVLAFGIITYYLDPLLQYGKEPGRLKYRHYTEMYCNPGIAKNYEYNAVFLGSSMVENADVSELDDLFNCKTIKVPYSGGTSFNHKTILDVCYNSGNKIDKVFWCLDEYSLTTDKNSPRYPLPTYLYDNNFLNDLSYLLNLDIFYFYTLKDVTNTLKHKERTLMKDGSWTDDYSVYSKENALASFNYPMTQKDNEGYGHNTECLTDNLNYNILPFLENHPETEFYFYLVPYSISYWYIQKSEGKLDADIYNIRTAIGEILKYKNAKVFFFQNDDSIITDLDNYKDYTHFHPDLNSFISKELTKQNYCLTAENYGSVIDDFHKYVTEFDYDGFYSKLKE